MKLHKKALILLLCISLALPGGVFAEEDETVQPGVEVPEVVVQPTESYDDINGESEVPVSPKPPTPPTPPAPSVPPAPPVILPPAVPVVEKSDADKKVESFSEVVTKEDKEKLIEEVTELINISLEDVKTYEDSKKLLETSLAFTKAIVNDNSSNVETVEKVLKDSQHLALTSIKSGKMDLSEKLTFSKSFLKEKRAQYSKESRLIGKENVDESTVSFAKEAIAEMTKVDIKKSEVNAIDITVALANIENIKNGLKGSLTSDQFNQLEENKSVAISIDSKNEEKSLIVDTEAASKLADNKADLSIETGDVTFVIKADTLEKMATKGVEMKQAPVEKDLPKKQDLSPTKATWDFSLNDTQGNPVRFTEKPSIRIELSQVGNDVDKGLLGVYIYDPITDDYEYVPTRIDQVTNEIVFDAPHFSIYTVMELDKEYADTNQAWAKREIKVLSAMHVIDGVGDNMFNPNGTLTRAQYTKMLVKSLHLTSDKTTNFMDVNENAWFADVARIAKAHGLVRDAINFNGNDQLSREEMAYMTAKALKYVGDYEVSNFKDASDIDSYAKDAVGYLVSRGDLQGSENSDGSYSFNPDGFLTRQEAVKVIYNILGLE